MKSLKDIEDKLPHLSSERNYWLVRAQGGAYTEDFFINDFIAIGYNYVTLLDLEKAFDGDEFASKIIADKIRKNDPEHFQPQHGANQIFKFAFSIKKGDIVIVPGPGSKDLFIGEVQEDRPYSEPNIEEEPWRCPYHKRKKVKWIKTVQKHKIPPQLYVLLYSRHTITEANNYSNYINRILFDFYIKNGRAHLVLNVRAEDDIPAKLLFGFGSNLLELVDDYAKEYNEGFSSNDVEVKLTVESPGVIELIGAASVIAFIGVVIVGLAGGGFKSEKLGIDISTPGLLVKVTEFLNSRQERKFKKEFLEKGIKNLKLEEIEEIQVAIEMLSNNNGNKNIQ